MDSMDSNYDVVVIGGGAAGVTAATQAARAGARTLLVEKSGQCGGTTTIGGVNFPGLFHAWGRQVISGIGWEWVTAAVKESGRALPDFSAWRGQRHWRLQVLVDTPIYAAIADRMLQAAGVDILFHTMLAKVEPIMKSAKDDGWRVTLCLKEGLQAVNAEVLVDCTGDANVVSQAGFLVRRNDALQPGTLVLYATGYDVDVLDLESLEVAFIKAIDAGEMKRSDFQSAMNPVAHFLQNKGRNSMHVSGVDGSTSRGKSQAELLAREAVLRIVRFFRKQPGLEGFRIEWCAAECGIRETVTIEGEVSISAADYTTGRVWPDSLCHSFYPIDVHTTSGAGGIDTRYLDEGIFPTIPLRAQLPKGSRGLIVAGRCASGDQEANSAYRVQASAMAMGQVAGAVAALAGTSGRELREVRLQEVRELLVKHQAIVPSAGGADIHATVPSSAPSGLLCDLLAHPERTTLSTRTPGFGWMPSVIHTKDGQVAYQIRVGERPGRLVTDESLCWDSGKVCSADSINVLYAGGALTAGKQYCWTVRTWNHEGVPSAWAPPQTFTVSEVIEGVSVYPLEIVEVVAPKLTETSSGQWYIDFARQAFGWLELDLESSEDQVNQVVRLGECAHDGAIDRNPPGSVRYAEVTLNLQAGRHRYRVELDADEQNTRPEAIQLPAELGVVLPFRYAEVELGDGALLHGAFQMRVQYRFDEYAASFQSSDSTLNAVWELCRYTIQATSFAGYYVDGDRERIPYEADAYINQLSHYAVDREFSMARRTHEYLLVNPTWPTEWKQHSILMAWADYEATGELSSLKRCYQVLREEKLLLQYARADGMLATGSLRDPNGRTNVGDLVDWPFVERDEYDFCDINTVVNAFHYRTLICMAQLAAAIGETADAGLFSARAEQLRVRFNELLFDAQRGVYVDGEGSDHVSQHGNLFPLAFGLVPDSHQSTVVEYVKSRGIACSVYAAQYLLEGLFTAGESEHAIGLMSGGGLRSWKNMLNQDATLTWEAWDQSLKPNQDWNHAWGTAPVNIIARYVLGVQPLEPGYGKVSIQPQLGMLESVEGVVPTIRGPIRVKASRVDGQLKVEVDVPVGIEVCGPGCSS